MSARLQRTAIRANDAVMELFKAVRIRIARAVHNPEQRIRKEESRVSACTSSSSLPMSNPGRKLILALATSFILVLAISPDMAQLVLHDHPYISWIVFVLGSMGVLAAERALRWITVNRATKALKYPFWIHDQQPTMFGGLREARKNIMRWYDLRLEKMTEVKERTGSRTMAQTAGVLHPQIFLHTTDPVLIQHILKTGFDVWYKDVRTSEILSDIIGNGIFAINHGPHSADGGESWLLQRKVATKIFTRSNFRTKFHQVFSSHTEPLARNIDRSLAASAEGTCDMQAVMFKYTLDAISHLAFSQDIDTLTNEDNPFGRAFDEAQETTSFRFISPLWNTPVLGKLLYAKERRMVGSMKVLNDFCYKVIAERRRELAEQPDIERNDLLSLFLAAEHALDDKALRDIIMSIMLAGRDTTATTLSFALLLLAQYPDVQEKARQELASVLRGRERGAMPSLEEMPKLKYLSGLVYESLRLYPPVPVDVKTAAIDDVLPDGTKVPAGTRIHFHPYIMGRSPDRYAEPAVCKPERWIDRPMPSPFEFPQFQAGPRICIGESMAKYEACLVLAFLLPRYEFRFPSDRAASDYGVLPGVTMKVRPDLRLRVAAIPDPEEAGARL